MAPISRLRAAGGDGTATSQMAHYYARRASRGGLIVAEASAISPQAVGQPGTPGMYGPGHVNSWGAITDVVHEQGGLIVAQLWHSGRLARSAISGQTPVSASRLAARGSTYAPALHRDPSEIPRALGEDEIETVIDQYRQAAENAADAGFDGVELHCANGCLADQFLQDGTNHRSDGYGGSIENRSRFLIDAIQALTSVWGPSRVGVRLSPFGAINDIDDSDPVALFSHVLGRLQDEGIAYVHLMEPRAGAGLIEISPCTAPQITRILRPRFSGVVIASGNFDVKNAQAAITDGIADAIAFGRPFIANPDLPRKLAQGLPLDTPDPENYFRGGSAGGAED
jgi:N-ethylmaleimide reductase